MTEAELKELVDAYNGKLAAMTDSERLRHWYEQKRSFARGMCASNTSYAEHCASVESLMPDHKLLTDAEIGLVLLGHYHASPR